MVGTFRPRNHARRVKGVSRGGKKSTQGWSQLESNTVKDWSQRLERTALG